jgi:acyl dehydratase
LTTILTGESLPALVGKPLGPGQWVEVTQARIDQFADATGDHQWIHVDIERAKSGPFGRTIAHGLLTLSMIGVLCEQVFRFDGYKMGVNYGYDRIRFPAPVRVGSKLRVAAKVLSFEMLPTAVQTVMELTVEIEGSVKPACVAQMIFRLTP